MSYGRLRKGRDVEAGGPQPEEEVGTEPAVAGQDFQVLMSGGDDGALGLFEAADAPELRTVQKGQERGLGAGHSPDFI